MAKAIRRVGVIGAGVMGSGIAAHLASAGIEAVLLDIVPPALPEAAKQSHFGGLVASGWHTVSVGHRMMVDTLFAEEARLRGLGQEPGVSGPSPGVNSMDFKVPVRPGDTVSYELVVTDKRASNSIHGWGLLFNKITAVNQRGELVYRADLVGFSKRRDYKMPLKLKVLLALTKLPLIGPLLKRGT